MIKSISKKWIMWFMEKTREMSIIFIFLWWLLLIRENYNTLFGFVILILWSSFIIITQKKEDQKFTYSFTYIRGQTKKSIKHTDDRRPHRTTNHDDWWWLMMIIQSVCVCCLLVALQPVVVRTWVLPVLWCTMFIILSNDHFFKFSVQLNSESEEMLVEEHQNWHSFWMKNTNCRCLSLYPYLSLLLLSSQCVISSHKSIQL